ncbi:MAG TPA: DUF485 domain-containing protein [Geobacteraceae bacterium]|jgi:uncharacterized membrane protein (DUF485 family)|nr:DUF485 domain-containing protein [Geobacteraceae bacterium]
MHGNSINWAAVAKAPKFVELHSKKKAFLFTWWLVGSVAFFALPVCAGYFPEVMKVRIIGRLNVGYFFSLFEFFFFWAIAVYYSHRSNTCFDPLTKEVLDEISREGGK